MNTSIMVPAPAAPEPALERPLHLRPSIFVLGGGTGHRIALYLKLFFLLWHNRVPDGMKILAFDTDDESLMVPYGDQVVTLEREREFFYIGKVPVAGIIKNLVNLPTIAERLPAIRTLPPIALLDGTGQNRLLGLLALLWHYDMVQRAMRDTLWEVAHRENLGTVGGVQVDASSGINVFQAGSLCGGNNSGQFLDMAFMARSELEQLGPLADFSKVVGVGVLPDAFRNTGGINLIPNTMAALTELNHVMVHGGFRADYRNGHSISTPRPPFDLYYVLGAVGEDGRTQLSRDEMCRMAALGLYHLAMSPIGGRQRSVFDNAATVLSQRTPEGEGTFFGSFGVAEIAFPAERVAAWAESVTAAELVRDGLLQPHLDATEIAAGWVQSLNLTAKALCADLAVDDAGMPLTIDLHPPTPLMALDGGKRIMPLLAWLQDVRRERIEGDYPAYVRERAAQWQRQTQASLITNLQTLRQQATSADTLAVLRQLGIHLSELLATLMAHRQTMESQERAAHAESEQGKQGLIHAGQSGWLTRLLENPIPAATDRVLNSCQKYYTFLLNQMVTDRAIVGVSALRDEARTWERGAAQQVEQLTTIQSRCTQEAATLRQSLLTTDRAEAAALALVTPTLFDQLLATHRPALTDLLAGVREHLMQNGQSADATLIERAVRTVVQPAFAPIRRLSIEQVMSRDRVGMTPYRRKQALVQMARPAWNLDETRLPQGGPQLARFTMVGVANADQTLFRDHSDQLVSTGDPHRLTAFQMTAGVPLSALRNYEPYQREYRLAAAQRALHILPGFHESRDDAPLALALGLIAACIEERQANFYYHPADPLLEAIYLGRGRTKAAHTLATHNGLVPEVLGRFAAHLEVQGKQNVLAQLTTFCEPEPRDDSADRTVKRLVRDYAATLQNGHERGG